MTQQTGGKQFKFYASAKLKELQGDSDWTPIQQIAIDVEAYHVAADTKLTVAKLREKTIEEIKERYKNEKEIRNELLEFVPNAISFSKWRKNKRWEPEVYATVKNSGVGLFSPDKRAKVINTLYNKILDKSDTTAAKLWLTMSGDYQENVSKTDETADVFREISKALNKQNDSSSSSEED